MNDELRDVPFLKLAKRVVFWLLVAATFCLLLVPVGLYIYGSIYDVTWAAEFFNRFIGAVGFLLSFFSLLLAFLSIYLSHLSGKDLTKAVNSLEQMRLEQMSMRSGMDKIAYAVGHMNAPPSQGWKPDTNNT